MLRGYDAPDPMRCQAVHVESLGHGEAGTGQANGRDAGLADMSRRNVDDVKKGNVDCLFDLVRAPMHRVTRQEDERGARPLEDRRSIGDDPSLGLPVALPSQLPDLASIDGDHDDLGLMLPARAFPHALIQPLVVHHRGFGTEAADDADHLHLHNVPNSSSHGTSPKAPSARASTAT